MATYGEAEPTIIITPEGFTENGYLPSSSIDAKSVAGFIGQAADFVGGCVDASTSETIDTSNAVYANTLSSNALIERVEEAMANNVFDLETPEVPPEERELEELDGVDLGRIFLADDYTGELPLESI